MNQATPTVVTSSAATQRAATTGEAAMQHGNAGMQLRRRFKAAMAELQRPRAVLVDVVYGRPLLRCSDAACSPLPRDQREKGIR